jgi:N-glycosylase/DNA lyase
VDGNETETGSKSSFNLDAYLEESRQWWQGFAKAMKIKDNGGIMASFSKFGESVKDAFKK